MKRDFRLMLNRTETGTREHFMSFVVWALNSGQLSRIVVTDRCGKTYSLECSSHTNKDELEPSK